MKRHTFRAKYTYSFGSRQVKGEFLVHARNEAKALEMANKRFHYLFTSVNSEFELTNMRVEVYEKPTRPRSQSTLEAYASLT